MITTAEQLLGRLGPAALILIFILVALDSSAFLGLVLPGEAIVLLSGALAGAGILNAWAALGAIMAGAIIGDLCGYLLGRYQGEALLTRWSFASRQYERHRA